ncbi:MAG TPA: D-2-hydroxyacid dehydrogenase, partial [Candidatus Tenderia electrophaga]|nr:D-2-hydroxyacid dehydrogenase [Candidatus Tenderia electrophaga]
DSRIASSEILISNKVIIDQHAMQSAPQLKLICVAATGTNNVDIGAAQRHNIRVCNVRGYATPSVSQHVFAMLLSLSIHLGKYRRAVMQGAWQQSQHFCLLDYPIEELSGKTLGIIGYGELGQAVANIATAFDMQVLISEHRDKEPRPGRVSFEQVLAEADAISLHCPLTTATQGLIGAAEIAQMKPGAILINTARGGIVNEQALADALRDGYLGGAGVDVLSQEPPLTSNPLLAGDIPNLIITPHIAWASRASRQRLLDQISANISAFLAGTPRNIVSQ